MSKVDDFLSLKKTAGPLQSFGRHAGMAATGALAAGAGAAMAGGIGAAVSHIVDAATKSHDFKEMLAANEDLHEHYQADPKKFNMMFSTLRTMNPQFSKDPLVAGAFMRQMTTNPIGLGGIAQEMLKSQRDFDHPIQDVFEHAAGSGAQAGLGQSLRHDEGARAFEGKKKELDYAHGLRQQSEKEKRDYEYGLEEHTEQFDDKDQSKGLTVRSKNRRF